MNNNSAANQLGLGGGIGGGVGYVLSNRLKNPNFTRHALMSVTFSIFGFNVVQFTGIKVIRDGPVLDSLLNYEIFRKILKKLFGMVHFKQHFQKETSKTLFWAK